MPNLQLDKIGAFLICHRIFADILLSSNACLKSPLRISCASLSLAVVETTQWSICSWGGALRSTQENTSPGFVVEQENIKLTG